MRKKSLKNSCFLYEIWRQSPDFCDKLRDNPLSNENISPHSKVYHQSWLSILDHLDFLLHSSSITIKNRWHKFLMDKQVSHLEVDSGVRSQRKVLVPVMTLAMEVYQTMVRRVYQTEKYQTLTKLSTHTIMIGNVTGYQPSVLMQSKRKESQPVTWFWMKWLWIEDHIHTCLTLIYSLMTSTSQQFKEMDWSYQLQQEALLTLLLLVHPWSIQVYHPSWSHPFVHTHSPSDQSLFLLVLNLRYVPLRLYSHSSDRWRNSTN